MADRTCCVCGADEPRNCHYAGHILRTPMIEHSRTRGEPRWCFGCRKRLAGDLVVSVPVDEWSYYGPSLSYRCDGCGEDRRLFPGWVWENEA